MTRVERLRFSFFFTTSIGKLRRYTVTESLSNSGEISSATSCCMCLVLRGMQVLSLLIMWHSFQTIFAGDFYALRALNKDFSMGKPTLHPNVQGTTTNRRTRTAALILLSCCLIFACLLGFKWTRPVLSALCESQGTPPENELNTARGLNPEDKPWSDVRVLYSFRPLC